MYIWSDRNLKNYQNVVRSFPNFWTAFASSYSGDSKNLSRFIAFLCLSFMNFTFYPDVRMYFWNVELAYSGDSKNLTLDSKYHSSKICICDCWVPRGSSTMGHKLVEIHFVRLQCFCPTLNGVSPKTISCHNFGHSFRECSRIEGGCCGLSPQRAAWLPIFCWRHEQDRVQLLTVTPMQQRLLSPT